MDSNQLEDEESFEVSLFRNGLTDNIRIGSRKIARITIRDDDSRFYINSVVCIPTPLLRPEKITLTISKDRVI